jgi:hypothetical protein
MSIEGSAVRQLLGVFWFKSIFPRFSPAWRERLFDALAATLVLPNHVLSKGRQPTHLADATHDELKAIAVRTAVNDAAGADLQLLLLIMRLWGEEARGRLQFVEAPAPQASSRLSALLGLHR